MISFDQISAAAPDSIKIEEGRLKHIDIALNQDWSGQCCTSDSDVKTTT